MFCLQRFERRCSYPHQKQMRSDGELKLKFSDLILQIVFCKIVLSVAVSDVTASTCCHSPLLLLLFTRLLWSQNNITYLCYILPTSTSISLSVMLFFSFFFFFLSDMTHRSVPLVRGLNALTLNIHEVLCIDHLWLKVGVQRVGYKAGPPGGLWLIKGKLHASEAYLINLIIFCRFHFEGPELLTTKI